MSGGDRPSGKVPPDAAAHRSPWDASPFREFTSAQTSTGPGAWFEGPSLAVERLREDLEFVHGAEPASLLIYGPPGSGRKRAAEALLASVGRLSEARSYDGRVRHGETTLAQGSARGPLVIEHLDDLPSAEVQRVLGLSLPELGHGRAPGPLGLVLLCASGLEELRARSLAHAQLLGNMSAELRLPSLQERAEDIPLLTRSFTRQAALRQRRPVRGISEQAMSALSRHRFPGNIGELRMMIELAVMRATGDWLTEGSFPELRTGPTARSEGPSRQERGEFRVRIPGASLRQIEMEALKVALEVTGGRVVRAAELLGITRHALRRKLEKFGLGELRAPYPEPRASPKAPDSED